MNRDFHHGDYLSDYVEEAKQIRASQKFRAETLRKIRISAASQTENLSEQHPAQDDDPFASWSMNPNPSAAKPEQNRNLSEKHDSGAKRLRSFLTTAAAFAIVGGTGFILYHRAVNNNPAFHLSENSDSSSAVNTDTEQLVKSYQDCNLQLSGYLASANEIFSQMSICMNPPTPDTKQVFESYVSSLRTTCDTAKPVIKKRDDIQNQLCTANDVTLFDAYFDDDGTLIVLIANGTDKTLTLSEGCSLTDSETNRPVGNSSFGLSKDCTTIQPHSSVKLLIPNRGDSMMLGQDYIFTLFNCGYRRDGSDSGTRNLQFQAVDAGRNFTEELMDALLSDQYRFTYTGDIPQPPLAVVEDILNKGGSHSALKDTFSQYQPMYTYYSDYWTFSPQLDSDDFLESGTRNVWILNDTSNEYFAEQLSDGEYHIYHRDPFYRSITEILPNK